MIPCYAVAVLVVAVILICAVVLMVIVNLPRDETPKWLRTTTPSPKQSPSPSPTPSPSPSPSPTPIPKVNYRLPLNIRPIKYGIDLRPYLYESDPRKFTFDGECFIEIQALQNTSQIQLHIMNLNISLSEYYKKNTTEKTVLPEATPNSLTDIVVYNLKEELQANISYILHYKYTGSINEDGGGFYRSKYITSDNVTKWFGAAQFQPTDARRVFPSFDEPNFKATFKLNMTHDTELQSMGPTSVSLILYRNKIKTVFFATTPIMSTYRLTFTVSEFYFRFDGQLGVVSRPEYSSQTEYSYNIGKQLLTAFNKYFNESVSAINPNQIHLDAVPNSELGESLLLYDNKQSTLNSQQVVANIVAYQVAHLWWGNLVTCRWWSDTWLNEGFANYFQYFGTELVSANNIISICELGCVRWNGIPKTQFMKYVYYKMCSILDKSYHKWLRYEQKTATGFHLYS